MVCLRICVWVVVLAGVGAVEVVFVDTGDVLRGLAPGRGDDGQLMGRETLDNGVCDGVEMRLILNGAGGG